MAHSSTPTTGPSWRRIAAVTMIAFALMVLLGVVLTLLHS